MSEASFRDSGVRWVRVARVSRHLVQGCAGGHFSPDQVPVLGRMAACWGPHPAANAGRSCVKHCGRWMSAPATGELDAGWSSLELQGVVRVRTSGTMASGHVLGVSWCFVSASQVVRCRWRLRAGAPVVSALPVSCGPSGQSASPGHT